MRRIGIRILACGAALLLCLPCGAKAQAVNWVAGDLPPFAWHEGDQAEGYAVDLLRALSERMKRPMSLQFYPWARAVHMTQNGQGLGVFPLARTPDREGRFQWLIPLQRVDYRLFSLSRQAAASPAPGLDALRRAPVGVLRGSPIRAHLQEQRFERIVEGKDYQELLRLLRLGVISAIYAGAPMLNAAIDKAGLTREQFEVGQSFGNAELYMACSLNVSEAELRLWRQAYQQLLDEGTVERLQQRWLR